MLRAVARVLLAVFMMTAGVMHFVAESIFVQIVPPHFPAPDTLVLFSGACEVALGALLLVPVARRLASYGLVALYVAVFPANIYMAVAHVQLHGTPSWFPQSSPTALWVRLPLQLVLIAWALWVGRGA